MKSKYSRYKITVFPISFLLSITHIQSIPKSYWFFRLNLDSTSVHHNFTMAKKAISLAQLLLFSCSRVPLQPLASSLFLCHTTQPLIPRPMQFCFCCFKYSSLRYAHGLLPHFTQICAHMLPSQWSHHWSLYTKNPFPHTLPYPYPSLWFILLPGNYH